MSDIACPLSLILGGQGVPSATSAQVIELALTDARTPLGGVLLIACHQAFLEEYASLTKIEQAACGVDLQSISTPESLLSLPKAYPSNAVVANTHLYLIQLLRYIATFLSGSVPPGTPPTSGWPEQDVGILGFSTGILAAVVIASITSIPAFISNSVEVYRSAFWLGLRAQIYATSLVETTAGESLSASWSLVTFGSTRYEIQRAVDAYNSQHADGQQVYLTVVTHNTCISVSGHPDALAAFNASYLPVTASSSRYSAIHTLYHSPALSGVKTEVMEDLARRTICFPSRAGLRRAVRSTVTGKKIPMDIPDDQYTLAEEVIDMTLLHVVNFDRVIEEIRVECASLDISQVRLVNVGPGNALWRSTARALPSVQFDMVDISIAANRDLHPALPPSVPASSVEASPREPIAIVGMAVKLPGAEDAAGLWKVLEKGLNTVSEIPKSRFDVSGYLSGAYGTKRTLKTRYGNFLDDASSFDNTFFRVSPREARSMDPQQRLLLQISYLALENAGYVPGISPCFDPDTFATYVGAATNDYVQNLRNNVDVYYSTGTLQAFLSGKISYAFGFSGPSLVIDTACSSSMVAIYQACRSLNNGDCNAAIAGGVNVISSPDMYIGLDRAHFLSPTGQCKPWDASADGYCRSEGCGMFVLKRLSDALAENDNILGVIRGIEVNQSANAGSITHPHAATQSDLFRKLMSSTGVEPHHISVIEAHGTGTKAGDPSEIQSIRSVFAKNRLPDNPLHLTSIKANIGHAEAASGAASLAKLLLMMRHHTIPAVISLKSLNPNICDLASDCTCIDTKLIPWPYPQFRGEEGRLALLNNFGAAGSNAALILQEGPLRTTSSKVLSSTSLVIGISCETEEALETQRFAYIKELEDNIHDDSALRDFAYTATARRQTFRYRLAGFGKNKAELCASLRAAHAIQIHEVRGQTVFVFSGQGAQYTGMSAALYGSSLAFRQTVDQCHSKLIEWGYPGIKGILTPSEGCEEEDFRCLQSAVFVLECALASVWISWGVQPDAVAGHSLGEYAALVTSGVLSLEDGLKLVAGRAYLMRSKCKPDDTGMLAVKLSPAKLEKLLAGNHRYSTLSVACYNSCDDGVLAGSLSQLDDIQRALKDSGHKCLRINVPYAYHTSAMIPILEDIKSLASKIVLAPPSIPVVSNVRGDVVFPGDASVFTPEYFARHCGQPVRFEQGIHELMSLEEFATVSAWIEIGPHPTTLPMLRSIPATSQQAMYLPSLKRNAEDWQVICSSLSSLYCMINTVDWNKVFQTLTPGAHVVELPAYPFAKTQYWVPFEEPRGVSSDQLIPSPVRFSLLGTCLSRPTVGSSKPAIFETDIEKLSHLIEGHKVSGYSLCPASVYIEAVCAAAELTLEHLGRMRPDVIISLSDIKFSNPLVYTSGVPRTVRIEITLSSPSDKHTGNFLVSSYLSDPTKLQPHCSGAFDDPTKAKTSSKLSSTATMVERRKQSMITGNSYRPPETFYTRTAYEMIFSRIVSYSSTYHTIKSITIDPNGVDAYAVVQLPVDTVSGAFVVHPVFTDTLLHAAGFVINCNAGVNEAFICSQLDKVKMLPDLIDTRREYGVYCNIGFLSETMAIADAYAFELGRPEVIIVAHLKRMRFRKLRLSGFKSILASAASHVAASPSSPQPNSPPLPRRYTLDPNSSASLYSERIKEVMAGVLGLSTCTISEDQDLERLGMDSLMSIEAHHALSSTLHLHIPDDIFALCKTIRDISAAISSAVSIPDGLNPQSRTESTLNEAVSPVTNEPACAGSLRKVRNVMALVLDVAVGSLSEDHDLERLGMDSLMSIEAHHALCTEFNVVLPEDVFTTCKTIHELHDVISTLGGGAAPPSLNQLTSHGKVERAETFGTDVNPVRLQDGDALPLFLIHDGSGRAHAYARLSPLGRPVWGIHNPKFASGSKWEGGLLEMATHYVSLIHSVLAQESSCIVGGWSFGGVIAFEVARQLIASGIHVPGVVLIDSPHPRTHTPLSDEVLKAAFSQSIKTRAMELARTQMQHATEALVNYDHNLSPAKHVLPSKAVMLRSRDGFHPAKSISQSDVFLAERSDPTTIVAEWEDILGCRVPVLDIPGNHFEPFESRYVGEVSERLLEALELLE